jgi:uncharacterized protein (TIGR02246 family)
MNHSKMVVTMVALTVLLGWPINARAGLMDLYNKANQAVNTVDNAKNTVKRAGNMIPKSAPKVSAPESTGTLTSKARTSIEKAKRAWVAAFKAEDWEALVDQYAEDAVILPPEEAAQSGREAIRAYFEDDTHTSNQVFETSDISGDSNIAYVHGSYSFDLAAEGQAPVTVSGKYIEIWQKQADGNWLITHDIWNSNPVETQ